MRLGGLRTGGALSVNARDRGDNASTRRHPIQLRRGWGGSSGQTPGPGEGAAPEQQVRGAGPGGARARGAGPTPACGPGRAARLLRAAGAAGLELDTEPERAGVRAGVRPERAPTKWVRPTPS